MAFELEPWEWHHGCLWRFPHQHLCWEGSLPANLLWTHCARTTQRDLSTRLAISRWHFQRTHCFTYTSDTSGFLGSILYGFPNDLGRFHSSEQRKLTVSFLCVFCLGSLEFLCFKNGVKIIMFFSARWFCHRWQLGVEALKVPPIGKTGWCFPTSKR